MDYFQYSKLTLLLSNTFCFKPYYKWITFNIFIKTQLYPISESFKPYYKWITFNILKFMF